MNQDFQLNNLISGLNHRRANILKNYHLFIYALLKSDNALESKATMYKKII